ncbi:hypothetical protein AB0J83_41910 [Actinoplanes sp. NPDC049596]|uniref:hypothetical protein n=1 Tax=unclassified Actinoplanes TaxID=2626549 RepID=UPI0034274EEE
MVLAEDRAPRAVRACSLLLAGFAVVCAVMVVGAVLAWQHFGPAADGIPRLPGDSVDKQISSVRTGLAYQTGLAVVAGLAALGLAVVVRRRRSWVQRTVWCTMGALVIGLLLGLTAGESTSFGLSLLPGWYPALSSVLTAILVATAVAVAVAMSRTASEEFHQPDPRQADPRWESFVRRQQQER